MHDTYIYAYLRLHDVERWRLCYYCSLEFYCYNNSRTVVVVLCTNTLFWSDSLGKTDTYLAPLSTRRKEMADRFASPPTRLWSRDGRLSRLLSPA